MTKIIHLTDTHLGYKGLSSRMREIISRIIFTKEEASNYVIVHTGDIVEDATDDGSYEEASMHFERLKSAGFHLLVVPGNHDYGTGVVSHKKYVTKFKETFFNDSTITYPKLDVIGNIAFIGLDSMAEELNWYDRLSAEGELGQEQLSRLSTMLSHNSHVINADHIVVYLHHHPFHPKPLLHLKDSDKLGEIIKKHNISAILFGHNHDGKKWNGKWGVSRIYDGGTSTGKHGKPCPHRVIDLSREPVFDYDAEF